MTTMKYSAKIRLISFITAAVAVMFGYILSGYSQAAQYRALVENSYSSAMAELSGYMENIRLGLEKELYCSSPSGIAALSNRLSADTACAKSTLEDLPVSNAYTSGIYRFLSQAGDYSLYLSKKSAFDITDEDKKNLETLYNYSKALSSQISDIQALAGENIGGYWGNEIKSLLAAAGADADAKLSELNASVQDIAQAESESPKLIYDGPFSDHMMQATPRLIADRREVSADAAKAVAAKYFGCDRAKVKYVSADNGNVRSYILRNGAKTAAVTVRGGELLYMFSSRDVAKAQLTADRAVKTAAKKLHALTGLEFKESYYVIDDNICTVNFAFYQDDVICYPDLIKVGIALDNGEMVSCEAGGFVMNHKEISPVFAHTESEARAALSSMLTAGKAQRCVINTGTDKEYACYEFACKGKNQEDILVYIDAETLTERNILILQKTDGGTLAQ